MYNTSTMIADIDEMIGLAEIDDLAVGMPLITMLREMRAAITAMAADLTEARAEIAALRGLPEGAVSSGWEHDSGEWTRAYGDPVGLTVAVAPDGSAYGWQFYEGGCVVLRGTGTAPTLRDAMRAADKAVGVGS